MALTDGIQTDIREETSLINSTTNSDDSYHIKSYYLNYYYYKRGIGVVADADKAVEWFVRALDVQDYYKKIADYARLYNNAEAHFICALILEDGDFVARADFNRALIQYQHAAAMSDKDALFELGRIYEKGECGVSPDLEAAERYYCLAAAEDHPLAQNRLEAIAEKKHAALPTSSPSQDTTDDIFTEPRRSISSARTEKKQTILPVSSTYQDTTDDFFSFVNSSQPSASSSLSSQSHVNPVIEALNKIKFSTATIPQKQRAESKALDKQLNKLWNSNTSFYLTSDEIEELYVQDSSIGNNPLMHYTAFIKGRLISAIQNGDVGELEESLKRLTTTAFQPKPIKQISQEASNCYFESWQVAFRLALSLKNNKACALLLRYAVQTSDATIVHKLRQFIPLLNDLQTANEALMSQESILGLLLNATKPRPAPELYSFLYKVYEQFYSRPSLKPLLELASIATRGDHELPQVQAFEDPRFRIFIDDHIAGVEGIKFDSNPNYSAVYSYGKKKGRNAIYVSLANYNQIPKRSRARIVHELAHFIADELYKNGTAPYPENAPEDKRRWMHVENGVMYGICGRLKSKSASLPEFFSDFLNNKGYSESELPSEVLAHTAEFLSAFDDEEVASAALYSIDPDLHSFYFQCFLPDIMAHIKKLNQKNDADVSVTPRRRSTTFCTNMRKTSELDVSISNTSSSYPPSSYFPLASAPPADAVPAFNPTFFTPQPAGTNYGYNFTAQQYGSASFKAPETISETPPIPLYPQLYPTSSYQQANATVYPTSSAPSLTPVQVIPFGAASIAATSTPVYGATPYRTFSAISASQQFQSNKYPASTMTGIEYSFQPPGHR